jgi:hypothetical protein
MIKSILLHWLKEIGWFILCVLSVVVIAWFMFGGPSNMMGRYVDYYDVN